MVRTPSYLSQSRHHIYYFRVTVPYGFPADSSGKELRRSLRTRDRQKAIRVARALRSLIEEHLPRLKAGSMAWQDLKRLLDDELNSQLNAFKTNVARHGPHPKVTEDIWEANQIPAWKKAADELQHEQGQRLLHPAPDEWNDIPGYVQSMADRLLSKAAMELDKSSDTYLKFCEATLLMQAELFAHCLDINRSGMSFDVPGNVPSVQALPSAHQQVAMLATPSSLLSDVVEEYCDEMKQGGNWQEKTEAEQRSSYALLIRVVRDQPIMLIDHEAARYYKKTLRKLPSNMNKKPMYREKDISEILQMQIPATDLLSVSTINTHLSSSSSLFTWAEKHGHTNTNPFRGLKMKEKKLPHEKREVFTESDLQSLFGSPVYVNGKRKHPYYYWLPLIALYSGARIEEICQLRLTDIHEEAGGWVFDINDETENDKKLKTLSSKRLIPIHSKLIDAGILDYCTKLKQKKETRLFPELKHQRDGYSQSASKWFGRYRITNGVPHKRKNFHSFRHTVANHLKQKNVTKEQIAAILGHKDESVTTGLYGKAYTSDVLRPVIEMLDYPITVGTF